MVLSAQLYRGCPLCCQACDRRCVAGIDVSVHQHCGCLHFGARSVVCPLQWMSVCVLLLLLCTWRSMEHESQSLMVVRAHMWRPVSLASNTERAWIDR